MYDNDDQNSLDQRRTYARRVMSNPTNHFLGDQTIDHPEVRPEWIEATIIRPYHQETDIDGNEQSSGAILGRSRWLNIVVIHDQVHTAYFDSWLTLKFGDPA